MFVWKLGKILNGEVWGILNDLFLNLKKCLFFMMLKKFLKNI